VLLGTQLLRRLLDAARVAKGVGSRTRMVELLLESVALDEAVLAALAPPSRMPPADPL